MKTVARKLGSWPATLMVALAMVVYVVISAVPLSAFWFEAGRFEISDAIDGESPSIIFERWIKRDVNMSYSVTIRNVDDSMLIVCDAQVGPFTYSADTTPVGPGALRKDLGWWANDECNNLPVGNYRIDTCWTARNLIFSLAPLKTTCTGAHFFSIKRS